MKYLITYATPYDDVLEEEIDADYTEIIAGSGISFYRHIDGDDEGDMTFAFYKMESFIKFKMVEEDENSKD